MLLSKCGQHTGDHAILPTHFAGQRSTWNGVIGTKGAGVAVCCNHR